jgi:HlyD family secretion protein
MARMRRARFVIAAVLVLLAGASVYYFTTGRSHRNPNAVQVSGNIEVTDAEVSFKIPGRVEQRLVDEGELVQKGACVAVLESADLKAELAMRKAELGAAQANLAELEAGARPEEIASAKARLASVKADLQRVESDYRTGQQLLETHVISQEDFVHRKALFESAEGRAREAAEQLKLVEVGPRVEQIEQARARVEQARAALGLAETRLGYARVVAPLSGVVLSKNIEAGEYVAPGTPVVTVGELNQPWLRAYIDETDLGRVKLGQKVTVTTDTYPGKKYSGTVSFIAAQAEFTPKNVQTQKERVKLVYRIKVDIPNPNQELKPGMPADAEILTGNVGEPSHGRD